MGEKSYSIGHKYIQFSEDNEFSCLCTFPHNDNEHLEIGRMQGLAIFGAVARLVFGGYYDDHESEYIFIPQDVPEWILRGVRKLAKIDYDTPIWHKMNMTFEKIKERFDQYLTNPQPVHPKIHGVIIGLLDKACGGKDNRYLFAATLGMKPHSMDWTNGQWCALYQMCKPDKVNEFGTPDSLNGKWMATNEHFQAVVDCVMRKIADNPLQMQFGTERLTVEGVKQLGEELKRTPDEIKAQMGFYDD